MKSTDARTINNPITISLAILANGAHVQALSAVGLGRVWHRFGVGVLLFLVVVDNPPSTVDNVLDIGSMRQLQLNQYTHNFQLRNSISMRNSVDEEIGVKLF